jgi:hypothetical protein
LALGSAVQCKAATAKANQDMDVDDGLLVGVRRRYVATCQTASSAALFFFRIGGHVGRTGFPWTVAEGLKFYWLLPLFRTGIHSSSCDVACLVACVVSSPVGCLVGMVYRVRTGSQI